MQERSEQEQNNCLNELIEAYAQSINDELYLAGEYIKEDSLKVAYGYLISGGGKRLRAILSLFTAGVLYQNTSLAIKQATAIELLHNFTLVHDDIMDNSPTRRGKDTIHKAWGLSVAILLGDIIVGLAYKLLEGHLNTNLMLTEFNNALIEVCRGQALDMEFNLSENTSVDEYFEMIRLKTSSLIKASILMGALSSDVSSESIDKLRVMGDNIGLAFQLQDDYLDLYGEEVQMGKRQGNDVVEGKKTYMMIRAKEILYHRADTEEQKKLINEFYNKNGLDQKFIPQIQKIITDFGIKKEVEQKVQALTNEALTTLSEFPESMYRNCLHNYIYALIHRNS